MSWFILLCMVFAHVIDDFVLQNTLARLKQRQWWRDNVQDPFYKHDYIVALLAHGFEWTFLILLPAVIYTNFTCFPLILIFYATNTIIHACIDHMKANQYSINLITDQFLHLTQIIITWVVFVA